jgi:hypothetical protein
MNRGRMSVCVLQGKNKGVHSAGWAFLQVAVY